MSDSPDVYGVAVDRLRVWRTDPVQFVRDLFHVEPDKWQLKALKAYGRQDAMRLRLAMQACVGPGKTAVLAWIACHFMLCFCGPDGRHPSGIAISESRDNLRDNLWKEIAHWRGRSPLLVSEFDITSERFFKRGHQSTWFISARSWPSKADPDAQGRTLAGLHSDFILYLIDESGDIPPAVLRAAEQGLGNCVWGRIVQAGNPTSHDGMLYHAAAVQPHRWEVIPITGDPDDPDRSPRVDLEWAADNIKDYGRNNPWVMAAILGKFPPTAVNALFGPDELEEAMNRHLREDQYNMVQKRIGVDVARFGDDATILCPRQGLWVGNMVEMRNADSNQVAARLMLGKQKFGSEMELIDSTGGWGSGVVDSCALASVHLYEVNFSGKADDPRYYNKRSEIAFRAQNAVRSGAVLPKDALLKRELCAIRYWYEKGQFRILEKKEIKKALQGHSPDRSDAWFVTYAVVDQPASVVDGVEINFSGGTRGKAVSEWDPYANS